MRSYEHTYDFLITTSIYPISTDNTIHKTILSHLKDRETKLGSLFIAPLTSFPKSFAGVFNNVVSFVDIIHTHVCVCVCVYIYVD